VTVTPDGRSAYAGVGLNPASVSQFDVATDGRLTPKTPATVASGGTNTPGGVVVNAAGTRAYVGNNAGSVSQLAIAPDGTLSPLTPLNVLSGGSQSPAIALTPDGTSLFAANRGANSVSRFAVSPLDGTLTLGASTAAGGQPNGVTVSADGHSVYVVNQRANDGQFVSQYDLAANGSLTPKTPPTVPSVATPKMLALSSDGHSAYVPNQGSGDVAQFTVAPDGTLTAKSPATVAAGTGAFFAVYSDGPSALGGPPSVETGAASAIADDGASLAGTVNPNGTATSSAFEYGPSQAFGSLSPVVGAGSGSATVPAAASLTGLTPNTTYYYRLVAVNPGGETLGTVRTFRTTGVPVAPVAVTQAATGTGTSAATLHGQVNPGGRQAVFTFEYGTATSFGAITPVVALDDADALEPVSASLTGLQPDTTYYARVVAATSAGTTLGAVTAFTTGPGGLPVVSTGAASGLTATGATLGASVDPHRLSTAFAFEYGTTDAFGSLSAVDDAGAGNGAQAVALAIAGLAPATTYRYRIVATNAGGTAAGAVQSFTTPAT
jgi:6-phosphogluconolactonase (cycloisomerase 2 family)